MPCTLLLRNQAKVAALSALGGKVTVERPSAASTSYQVAGEVASCNSTGPGLAKQQQQQDSEPIKRLLVTTKATDAVSALAAVKHRLSSDSVVLLLTNGVLGVYMEAVSTLFPPWGEAAAAAPSFLLGMTTHGKHMQACWLVACMVYAMSRRCMCAWIYSLGILLAAASLRSKPWVDCSVSSANVPCVVAFHRGIPHW
jgi:ketopantoate reductase